MKVQSQNNSLVKANFFVGLTNKKLWIILILVNIFGLPYAILQLGLFNDGTFFNLIISAFALVVNVIMGMVIPFLQFDYYYDRTKVDMAYSLPLTRRQKFLSDFFSGLSMYVGAYIIQIVLSYLSVAISLTFGDAKRTTDYYVQRFFSMGEISLFQLVSRILLIILLMQIMLYVVTAFIISCVGAVFEAVSAIIYTNILLASTVYVIYMLCANQLFGMDFYQSYENVLMRTSPLGGFFYLLIYGVTGTGIVGWTIAYLISTIIFSLGAYFIMTRRKAESVGKPFVVRIFYHVILVAIMLHIGLLAFYTGNSLVTFILMTLIFYLIVETITNRGFKKVGKSLVRYGIIIASTLVIIITINKTECFGIAYKVADVDDVDAIEISYEGMFSDYYTNIVTITSKESIATLLEVQQNMINRYKECKKQQKSNLFEWTPYVDYHNDSYIWENLSMKVIGSKNYYRNYYVPYEEVRKLLEIELSDEYIDARVKTYKKNANYLISEDVFGFNSKTIVMDTNGTSAELLDEFFECLRADLKETTIEEYIRPENQTKYNVRTNWGVIPILDSYTNCMQFLEKHDALPAFTKGSMKSLVDSGAIEIFNFDHVEIDTGYYCTNRNYYTTDSYIVTNYSEDVEELLQKVQRQYASDEECFLVEIYGTTYIVPAEYSDLVERIIQNDSTYYDEYYKY